MLCVDNNGAFMYNYSRVQFELNITSFLASIAQEAERVLGNYRMDVRKINVEDSIFPLPTGYNNKTEYAYLYNKKSNKYRHYLHLSRPELLV